MAKVMSRVKHLQHEHSLQMNSRTQLHEQTTVTIQAEYNLK
jgi:hypothetical protein